jgi:hypothetical protein
MTWIFRLIHDTHNIQVLRRRALRQFAFLLRQVRDLRHHSLRYQCLTAHKQSINTLNLPSASRRSITLLRHSLRHCGCRSETADGTSASRYVDRSSSSGSLPTVRWTFIPWNESSINASTMRSEGPTYRLGEGMMEESDLWDHHTDSEMEMTWSSMPGTRMTVRHETSNYPMVGLEFRKVKESF